MKLNIMPLPPIGANCYLLSDSQNRLTIIDPGGEPETVIKYIEANKLIPLQILFTHGHFDHIGAAEELKAKYNIPIFMHDGDTPVLAHSAKALGLDIKATNSLNDRQVIKFEAEIHVIHTPGHSTGGVCFYIPDMKAVFTGDTLFERSVGRTDLPHGDPKALVDSIANKLYKLDDDTIVYPGHGDKTTIGEEKRLNPFVRGAANAR
ncbi:MAG: MBL fold metallo-hydrolase [Deferribacteraceae bacterium]|jgi:glyoxylase-like metal-dependent hydrolase (beta-lactamase superfamily II)|nr:MBL fold metallo-hydrolase [Deferribacteraceae bacterium]